MGPQATSVVVVEVVGAVKEVVYIDRSVDNYL